MGTLAETALQEPELFCNFSSYNLLRLLCGIPLSLA